MERANQIPQDFMIAVGVAGGADEFHIAAHAGKILLQLSQQAHGGVPIVVELVVRKSIAERRGQDRAVGKLATHRQRRLAIEKAGVQRTGPLDLR